jgi:glycosyl transferase family 4
MAFWRRLKKSERVSSSGQPREIDRSYSVSAALPSPRNSPKKICMLAYTGYESDNRVRRYAEALVKRGDQVDVIALSGGNVRAGTENIRGVTVHRIQRRESNERHMRTYVWRLLRFLVVSSLFLTRRHRRIRYDLIQIITICAIF